MTIPMMDTTETIIVNTIVFLCLASLTNYLGSFLLNVVYAK